MTLTKDDLVQQIYKNHEDLTKAQAKEAIEAFLRISKGAQKETVSYDRI